MKYLSLFSGIEAASVAWVPLGWSPVAFAEVEPFPCSVLRHHYPHVPNLGDVTRITRQQVEALGCIDLVCGGFPCQDLSVAGKRKGLMNADGSATRSGLFFDAMFLSGEEIEGPDGLAVMVDMSVWNAALDSFEGIIGDEMEPAQPQASLPTVEQVEASMGMGHGAWDMVDPNELIKAIVTLAAAPKASA